MAEFFGFTSGRGSESAMADSLTMRILHTSMNRAHDRVRSSEGVLQRLHEQSKFCDLAVMQLDACLSCLRSASDHRDSAACCKVIADLTEIRDRLLGRLRDTERAIVDKDKELQKLRSYYRNHRSRKEEDSKDDSGSVDGKKRVKEDSKDGSESVDGKKRVKEERSFVDHERKKSKDCDPMGSDINSLKHTLDVAMLVMRNAISSVSDVRPTEMHLRWAMEKEITLTLFGGFVRDLQQIRVNKESITSGENSGAFEAWSELMDDLSGLRSDLHCLLSSNETDNQNLLPGNGEEGVNEEANGKMKETNEFHVHIQRVIERLNCVSRWSNKGSSIVSCLEKHMGHGGMISSDLLEYRKDKQVGITRHTKSDHEVNLSYEDGEEFILQDSVSGDIQSILYKCVIKDCLREDNTVKILKESVKVLASRNEEQMSIANSMIASETRLHLESIIREKVCTVFLKEMATAWSAETEEFRFKSSIEKEVYQLTILNMLKDAYSMLDRCRMSDMSLTTTIKPQASNQLAEIGDCDDQRELDHQEEVPAMKAAEERKQSSSGLNLSGFGFLPLGDFSQVIGNFGNILHQKVDAHFVRLERLKRQLHQSTGAIVSLKRKESLYRQAFIRRCENLQKAEAEVDVLGDQVNALLNLLERIYATLQYHAPALRQCSGMLNILTLIKKELDKEAG